MMIRMSAALVALLVAGVQAAPQPPAGKVDTPASAGRAALDRGDLAAALAAYERLAPTAPERPALLSGIALARARQLSSDADAPVVVEACRAQVAAGTAACVPAIRRISEDSGAEIATRLAAATVLVQARVPNADNILQTMVGIASSQSPAVAADALARRRDASVVAPLTQLANNPDRDAKYLATLALVRIRSREALPVLRGIAADPDSGAARLIAYIGLAAAGDREALAIVNQTLPLMKGRDLLEAGRALVVLGDPRGPGILRAAADEGTHEMVRVEAAEALHASDPALAARLIRAAADAGNPWVRAQALEAAARLRLASTPSMRRAMLDTNGWVAVRAVQAVAAGSAAGPQAR